MNATRPRTSPAAQPRVERFSLQQFKSIKKCEVALGPVTILAGRNGAGKSNILDGIRFVADALRDPLDQALRLRGGLAEVRRRQLRSRPTNPKFRVVLDLGGGCKAHFGFDLVANAGAFTIRERCSIETASGTVASYKVNDGVAEWTLPGAPPVASKDRLYLVSVSGLPEFRPVFDALTRMSFHNLNAKAIKFPRRRLPLTRSPTTARTSQASSSGLNLTAPTLIAPSDT